VLKLSSTSSNGLGAIKDVLSDVEACKGSDVSYLGGGTFKVSCAGLTFKDADKALSSSIVSAEKKAKKLGVSFEYKKQDN
jgi:translation initiation factor 2 alpha subunit (eIF-2alpha)